MTSIDSDGRPVGMAVGSFTSVSLNPPLVAFLPDKGSTTFPKIRAAGRFCVNVLSSSQEATCRAFAVRGGDKFASAPWQPAPSGSPILDGVVAWIDCDLDEVHEAGDHFIVVGRVTSLAIDNPVTPLVFFQGGYGTFAMNSLVMGVLDGWSEQILMADKARGPIEQLARETGMLVRAYGVHGDDLVVVASASPQPDVTPSGVGLRLPFVPPFGRGFLAWSDDAVFDEWCSRSPHPLTEEQRRAIRKDLETERSRGWVATKRSDGFGEIWSLAEHIGAVGQTPALARQIASLVRELDLAEPEGVDVLDGRTVQGFSAPVFDADGKAALVLSISGIPAGVTSSDLVIVLDELRATTRTIASVLQV
ncbi:flavin reductase [Rhodococcus sp. 14C212]|nr:flavin reductase [Rhodococcus sp. 14C212]